MKHTITIERVRRDFWRLEIEADNERQAIRKALKQARKEADEDYDVFCDGDEPKYKLHSVEPVKP